MSQPEIGHRVPFTMLAELPRHGVDVPRLIDGLPFTAESLRDPRGFMRYDDFIELMDRVREALGGPLPLADFCGEIVTLSPPMRAIGALVLSPRRLYLSVCERVTHSLYRTLGTRVCELPDGRIRIEQFFPPGVRDATSFHYGTYGTLQRYPRLVGAADAVVEAEIRSERAIFVIDVPDSNTVAARARRLLRSPLDWMRAAHPAGIEPTQEDIFAGAQMAFGEEGARSRLDALSGQLAEARALPALAERFSSFLRDNYGSGYLALSLRAPDGRWLAPQLCAPVAAPESPRVLPVTLGGQVLASATVDVPQLSLGEPAPLLDAALGLLALALARLGPGETGRRARRETAAQSAAARWRLTGRQGQTLRLLAAGCANKEIARILGTSVKTVEAHVTGILAKAGCSSRGELTARLWEESGGDDARA